MADPNQNPRDPDVVAYTGFAGIRNDVSPERFGPTDLAFGDNIDIDKTGRVSRRAGRTQRSAIATHSLWTDGTAEGYCVQGTNLKKIAPDYSLTTIKTGLTADLRVRFTKVNDVTYFSNARENGAIQNTTVRSWGLPVPALPTVVVGVGNMPAGTYQYVMTYVRNDGQESGAGVAAMVTVANGKLTFSWSPPSDPTIAYVNIYLTAPDGDVLYRAFTAFASAGTASYAGNAKELTYDLKTQFLSPPPAGHLHAYYSGRLYVAVDDVIYPSEPFAYELFDLRKYIPMPSRVTLLAAIEDKETIGSTGDNSGFFVGTDKTCGILVGNEPGFFQYVPKADYGAVEGALDYVDGSLFNDGGSGARRLPMWLSTQGLCVGMPGLEIRNLTRSRYSFTAAGLGAAHFMPVVNRFIAISNY